MDIKLINKLKKREEEGTFRSLSHFEGFIDFFSNDYLGLSTVATASEVTSFGGTGSRLISGTSQDSLKAEQLVAGFFSSPSSLIFNSGYDANIGFFSSVPQRGDTVLFDERIHASVRDGLRLGFANSRAFSHNNILDLQDKLFRSSGTRYVVVESLYSMDGDLAPLRLISETCQKYGAYLIVDEAHSCGVYGDSGMGLVHALALQEKVFARITTFGKAYGSHGACILGSIELIDYLTNFARSFIYTTALPPSSYARIGGIIQEKTINERRNSLQENIKYFRSKVVDDRLISEVNSPIQVLELGNIASTKKSSELLLRNKIAVKPIFSPTVPVGKERLRICIHAQNTRDEIDVLAKLLTHL